MAPPRSRRAAPGTLTASATQRMRISYLQNECRTRNLSAAGNRADLIERLRPFFGQPPPRRPEARAPLRPRRPPDPDHSSDPGSDGEDGADNPEVRPRQPQPPRARAPRARQLGSHAPLRPRRPPVPVRGNAPSSDAGDGQSDPEIRPRQLFPPGDDDDSDEDFFDDSGGAPADAEAEGRSASRSSSQNSASSGSASARGPDSGQFSSLSDSSDDSDDEQDPYDSDDSRRASSSARPPAARGRQRSRTDHSLRWAPGSGRDASRSHDRHHPPPATGRGSRSADRHNSRQDRHPGRSSQTIGTSCPPNRRWPSAAPCQSEPPLGSSPDDSAYPKSRSLRYGG